MVARMALAVWPFDSRSWNELKTEKIAPSFGASVNVAPSKPAKAAVEKTTRNRRQDIVHLPRHFVGSRQ